MRTQEQSSEEKTPERTQEHHTEDETPKRTQVQTSEKSALQVCSPRKSQAFSDGPPLSDDQILSTHVVVEGQSSLNQRHEGLNNWIDKKSFFKWVNTWEDSRCGPRLIKKMAVRIPLKTKLGQKWSEPMH